MWQKSKVQRIAVLAFLIALTVVLTRFCSIVTPVVRIGFGFLPCALMGIMFGPLRAGAGSALADLLGAIIFPTGPYFPGFTLTAFLTGSVYGIFYHGNDVTLKSSILPNMVVCVLLNFLLNTLWIAILMGEGFLALLPARIIKCVIMFFVQTALIPLAWNKLILRIPGLIQ